MNVTGLHGAFLRAVPQRIAELQQRLQQPPVTNADRWAHTLCRPTLNGLLVLQNIASVPHTLTDQDVYALLVLVDPTLCAAIRPSNPSRVLL